MFKGYFPGMFMIIGLDHPDAESMFSANNDDEYQWKIRSIFRRVGNDVIKIRVDKVQVITDLGTKVYRIDKL
jgi:hypothetical protein